MNISPLLSLSAKKSLLVLGAVALGAFAVADEARASTTFTVGGGMGSASFQGDDDPYRTFGNPIVFSNTFKLPPGTWQPFMGGTTSWRIFGANSNQFAGEVRVDILAVGLFGGQTIVSSFVRSVDSEGGLGLDDDQDFGSFVSSDVLPTGGQNFIIRTTANAMGGNGYASKAHVINTRVMLLGI